MPDETHSDIDTFSLSEHETGMQVHSSHADSTISPTTTRAPTPSDSECIISDRGERFRRPSPAMLQLMREVIEADKTRRAFAVKSYTTIHDTLPFLHIHGVL